MPLTFCCYTTFVILGVSVETWKLWCGEFAKSQRVLLLQRVGRMRGSLEERDRSSRCRAWCCAEMCNQSSWLRTCLSPEMESQIGFWKIQYQRESKVSTNRIRGKVSYEVKSTRIWRKIYSNRFECTFSLCISLGITSMNLGFPHFDMPNQEKHWRSQLFQIASQRLRS